MPQVARSTAEAACDPRHRAQRMQARLLEMMITCVWTLEMMDGPQLKAILDRR